MLFCASLLCSSDVQVPTPIALSRLSGPVTLDGFSDEAAWRDVRPLPMVMMEPNFGAEPSERSEILAGYDDRYLYLAGRLYDREPDRIVSNSKQRDSDNASCDWFGLIIDSFNDKQNAVAFFTTPAGLRWDAAVLNDGQGNRPIDPSWNTFWDVATARDGRGWFAEFRIPFSSLRFQDRAGRVVMGLIVWRSIVRKNEWDIFPAIPPDWGFWSKFKPSRAQEVALEGVSSRRPLYIVPYLLGGLGQAASLNPDATGYGTHRDVRREAGLDLKYGLTSNLTLDATLNTDFAQVEADDEQVNLTRFSLFFPEKRLFFLERAAIFNFEFERLEQNRLFYSRRIGLDDGRPVRIYGGARLVGRLGDWDLGALDLQTEASAGIPSTNFGVLRLRRQIVNPYSYAGGILTSRVGADGRFNLAYGLDATIRMCGDDYLIVRWAQTFSRDKPNQALSFDPAKILATWVRDNLKGFGYGLTYSRSGRDFDPELGFELRHDYTRVYAGAYYGWFPGERSPLLSHRLSLESLLYRRNGDGALETLNIGPNWYFTAKNGLKGYLSPYLEYEDVPEAFSLSPQALIPVGRYTFFNLAGELQSPSGKPLSALFDVVLGTFYDGRRVSLSANPVWSVSSSLSLDAAYQLSRADFPGRDERLTAHILRLRALYMFDTRLSVTAFVQYNRAAGTVIGNLRLRYNPREGVDLYLVYNESLNTSRFCFSPPLPLSSGRTLLFKYSYTFGL
jgi:hypothetical protein